MRLIFRALIALALMTAAVATVRAQQTQSGIAAEITTKLPSGEPGGIPAVDLRQVLNDMNLAIFQAQGGSGLVLSGTPALGSAIVATSPTAAVWSRNVGLSAANNTALSALPSTYASSVTRLGFAVVGDSPPVLYAPSAGACTLNAGAGDGGSQVQTSDGKCWIADIPSPAPVTIWGAKGDRTTDNTTALTRALAYIAANGGRISLPIDASGGTYGYRTGLVLSQSAGVTASRSVGIVGPGILAPIPTMTGAALTIAGNVGTPFSQTIDGVTFDCSESTGLSYCLQLKGTVNAHIENNSFNTDMVGFTGAITAVTYNSTNGATTLTLAAPLTTDLALGSSFKLTNITGGTGGGTYTGLNSAAGTPWVATAGTGGTTVNFTATSGLGTITSLTGNSNCGLGGPATSACVTGTWNKNFATIGMTTLLPTDPTDSTANDWFYISKNSFRQNLGFINPAPPYCISMYNQNNSGSIDRNAFLNCAIAIAAIPDPFNGDTGNAITIGPQNDFEGDGIGIQHLANPTINLVATGTYNSGTGATTIHLASSAGALVPGNYFNITSMTSAGCTGIIGNFMAAAGSGGTTINFVGPTGQTMCAAPNAGTFRWGNGWPSGWRISDNRIENTTTFFSIDSTDGATSVGPIAKPPQLTGNMMVNPNTGVYINNPRGAVIDSFEPHPGTLITSPVLTANVMHMGAEGVTFSAGGTPAAPAGITGLSVTGELAAIGSKLVPSMRLGLGPSSSPIVIFDTGSQVELIDDPGGYLRFITGNSIVNFYMQPGINTSTAPLFISTPTVPSAAGGLVAGEIGMAKITASVTAPGAGAGKLEWVAGTMAGTCKLIAFAGTSNTPATIIDNVGAGC